MIELPTTSDGARRPGPSIGWPQPASPALRVESALDRVRRAPSILRAMRTTPDVVRSVEQSVRQGAAIASILASLRSAIADQTDTVAGLAAVHALASLPGDDADAELLHLLHAGRPGFEEHAIWALAGRPATIGAVFPLARVVAGGGLSGMLAQRTLARWAAGAGDTVLAALGMVLQETASADSRRYLVETIGLLQGRYPSLSLEHIATDASEAPAVRAAAIAAFSQRTGELLPQALTDVAREGDEMEAAVTAVRARRSLARRRPRRTTDRRAGIRVAHIHLAAVIDPEATSAGIGEAGGVATLLGQLGSALSEQPRIAEVLTVGRARPGETAPRSLVADGRRDEGIPLAPGEGITFAGRWPALVEGIRGVRAAFLAGELPDVVHLRMADPGTLAGAIVARELGIPTVFSLAPDPHGPIAAAEAGGSLDRRSFAETDGRSALWYRANLVERLARDARELVLFPRSDRSARLAELTGIDVHSGPPRHTVVPEGVDTARIDRAVARVADASVTPSVIADLVRAIEALPRDRHGLPVVISVGRMQEAKGMARLVEAFAHDETLAARANLVIVGGDLDDPSMAEAAELARIRSHLARHPHLADSVVLLGHRPHADVATLLAATRTGWGAAVGPGGSYACASLKEEFGLAIVEAMAAGLPVVAPNDGGPVTYVEDDVTGALVDTGDVRAIADGIHSALDLAADPLTAGRTRAVVDARFTLARMARTLAAVYRVAAAASTLALPVRAVEPAADIEIAA